MFNWLKTALVQDAGRDIFISLVSGATLINNYGAYDPTTVSALVMICLFGLIGIVRTVIRRRRRKQLDVEMLSHILQILETISQDPELVSKIVEVIDSQLPSQQRKNSEGTSNESHSK